MQTCNSCGADLPENTRFCGKCGSVQDATTTDAATTMIYTPQSDSWESEDDTRAAVWPPNVQAPITPPPLAEDEDEDERRRAIPPWSPLYDTALGGDALLGSGQASAPGAPVVQGTPQLGSVPTVSGSPTPFTNAPAQGAANASAGSPAQGAANASAGPPAQGAANTPLSHPVQGPTNVPVSHPTQGPTNLPSPQPGPQPMPEPPGEPGTHKHPGPHKHHEHQSHHAQYRAASATKAAGGSLVKTIILVVISVVVVVAGGIGALLHFQAHPQPLISISSNYKVGNTLAGAQGTVLHISGQQFSSNSAITFLLDGHAAPGNPGTQSDSNGTFRANMTITDAWSVGTHTLTASDASNHSTQNKVSVTVVQPGQANTPGPNGAPADDASFKLKVTIANALADPFSQNPVLIITGHPDPEGGTVCSPDDNGQSFTFNETASNTGTPFTKTLTATCSGTYKAGQISFIETSTSVTQYWQYSGVNVTCVLNNPTVDLRLTGAYAGNNTFSGTLSSPYFTYTCDQGYNNTYHETAQGVTWTGTIVTQ